MACCLSPGTGAEDFRGAKGKVVTVDLVGPDDAGSLLVHIQYGSTIDVEAPFQFTIAEGDQMLVLLALASAPGTLLQLVEKCNGITQVLNRFHFDPRNPGRGFLIRGV